MSASHPARESRLADPDRLLRERIARLVAGAAPRPERVVVYADAPAALIDQVSSAIAAATASWRRRPTCTLVVASAPSRFAADAWSTVSGEALPSVRLQSPFAGAAIAVPRLLLEPSLWITVTRLRADRHYGARTPLALHAELLRAHNPRLPRVLLAAEAYRLAPADLCCTFVPTAGGGYAPWLDDDLLVAELALAGVSGVRAAALPHLRRIARHFALPGRTDADRPSRDLVLPRLDLAEVRMRARLELLAHHLRGGLGAAGRAAVNLRRAPDFLRRRALALRETRG